MPEKIKTTEEITNEIAESIQTCNRLADFIREISLQLETASADYRTNLTKIMMHDNHTDLLKVEYQADNIQQCRRKMQANMFAVTSKIALNEALNRLP
jgi:hypothetical protein